MAASITANPNPVGFWSPSDTRTTTISWDTDGAGNGYVNVLDAGAVGAVEQPFDTNAKKGKHSQDFSTPRLKLGGVYLFKLYRESNNTLLATVTVSTVDLEQQMLDRLHRSDDHLVGNEIEAADPLPGGLSDLPNPAWAIAYDRLHKFLYVASQAPHALYRVDKSNGAATLIGAFGVDYISALDFDPTTGILYGAYAVDNPFGHLYTIDIVTGHATLVADTHRLTALSFDENGVLYGADNGAGSGSTLFRLDKSNGSFTTVAGRDW
jgi:hypothetical protein